MTVDRAALEALERDALVVEARRWDVKKPEVMTRVELTDEIVRLATPNPVERKKARGWLGVARDLLASAVERGLNLPDAAALIRGDLRFEPLQPPQAPVATVTLAEIYGAQGHVDRALGILKEVLSREPEHAVARRLQERLLRERAERPARGAVTVREAAATASAPEVLPEPVTVARGLAPPEPPDDAAVLTRTGPTTASVRFEVGSVSIDEAVVVRVVELSPRASSVERSEQDLAVGSVRGVVTISGLEPGGVARAALGVLREGRFHPLAVAGEVRVSSGRAEIVWSPRRGVDPAATAARLAAAT